jgi:hypothetical protein
LAASAMLSKNTGPLWVKSRLMALQQKGLSRTTISVRSPA